MEQLVLRVQKRAEELGLPDGYLAEIAFPAKDVIGQDYRKRVASFKDEGQPQPVSEFLLVRLIPGVSDPWPGWGGRVEITGLEATNLEEAELQAERIRRGLESSPFQNLRF